MIRVITGQYKGFKLFTPPGNSVRPTTNRVKEYIFSVLNQQIKDNHVLDLFAGSGNLGIEALSRGAGECKFVDSSSKSLDFVRRNIEKCGCQAQTFRMNAESFLKFSQQKNWSFDLVFCDPPYNYKKLSELLLKMDQLNILQKKCFLICETGPQNTISVSDTFQIFKQKNFGDTQIIIYQYNVE